MRSLNGGFILVSAGRETFSQASGLSPYTSLLLVLAFFCVFFGPEGRRLGGGVSLTPYCRSVRSVCRNRDLSVRRIRMARSRIHIWSQQASQSIMWSSSRKRVSVRLPKSNIRRVTYSAGLRNLSSLTHIGSYLTCSWLIVQFPGHGPGLTGGHLYSPDCVGLPSDTEIISVGFTILLSRQV